jgi:hypothetical protein
MNKTIMLKKTILHAFIFLLIVSLYGNAQTRKYYTEPTWQPRAILPYADAINNDFWPASPKVETDYNDPDFDETRLSKVPAPGIYPRVLITPTDVERIQAKIALGDKAPKAFKVMWQRVSAIKTPFYALVTNNDSLGRKLAVELVGKIKSLEPKIDVMNKRPDSENIWAVERSIIASGEPNPPVEIWDLLEYDYLHKWMTNDERELARRVIAKVIKNRISNFLMVPDHFMINNHEGFGMEYIRLMLLIEGQEGFDKKLFDLAVHKANAMLDWFLDKDGMCYESIKGWLNTSAMVAVGLRKRDLLKHSHLRAKINFFLTATRWENNEWHIRDEMRASAFHVIWMMRYYHPTNQRLDFLYQSTFTTHPFLNDASVKWPDPVGVCYELLLLYAEDGMVDNAGKHIDWNNQTMIDKLQLPTTWQDSTRGYVEVRNSWRKDDLKVGFVCKQDFFYGGHEGSENNRLTLWKDGVNWIQDNNMLATKATFLQNMLTIDGKGLHWPPVAGNWLGIKESKQSLMASGDGKIGYSFTKIMQVHPLYFPSAKLPYYKPFTEGNFDLSRDIQVAFQPSTIAWNNGYAHTDYGPWSGETRLVESYKPFNQVQKAYRTIQVAKGKYPYLLVIDDVQKDNQLHHYDWNISVPVQATLVEVKTPEIVFQNTEPSNERTDDLVIASRTIAKDSLGKPILQKGEPLCLIRVLWRNTEYGFGVPSLQQFEGYSLINIPAHAISPDFKVLVYPYKYGDPLPITEWNKDKTQLTVTVKEQKDVYQFALGDGGRTALQMNRNNESVAANDVLPSKPILIVRNTHYNASDTRYTRDANVSPTYVLNNAISVLFQYPENGAKVYYTLDGTEPNVSSPVFTKPVIINKTCILKAKTVYEAWPFASTKSSETITAYFKKQTPSVGLVQLPLANKQGLDLILYEINTKPYNDKGFFDADRIMMPDVKQFKATYEVLSDGFTIPYLSPTKPLEQQVKGFYAFTGFWYAKETGVYKFNINSCGPVTFDVDKQSVVASVGIFHQQQAVRSGEIVLAKGWHTLELIVCDPLFWNVNSLDNMPLQVSYQFDDNSEVIIQPSDLRTNSTQTAQRDIPSLYAVANISLLEKGFELKVYDRTGKRRDADFMNVDSLEPFIHQRSSVLETANSKNSVRVYDGYYFASTNGIYQFTMPLRVGDNVGLGGTQASCQSLLKIDNTDILQHGIYGKHLSGKVLLKQGWHKISIRLGTGFVKCAVVLPSGQTVALDANNIYRHAQVNILPNNEVYYQKIFELYDSVQVKLEFKNQAKSIIRYTLDGSTPTLQSSIYDGHIYVSQSCTLQVIAFENNQPITTPAIMIFQKVTQPTRGSLGVLRFDNWDGKNSYYNSGTSFKVWLDPNVSLTSGITGKAIEYLPTESGFKNVDVNVSRGITKAACKLYDINMKENALTVSIWFKTKDTNGKLFGKDGYNAFGKGYKTISCGINNGKYNALGYKLVGGQVASNTWQHIVLASSEEGVAMYLNGSLIATAAGTKDINTDALDFFTGLSVTIDQIQLFDRYLKANEVERLFSNK